MTMFMKSMSLFALAPLMALCAPLQFVSHAGDASSAPAHSLPAYQVALENQADILKLDLHFTKDKVIVLQHDPTLKRMMGWNVKIADCDYRDILENGVYKPKHGFDKEKIVTLEQALQLVQKSSMSVWLDPKGYTPELVDAAIALLKNYDIKPERVMFATFSVAALKYVRDNYPEYRRVLHISVPVFLDKDGKAKGYTTSFDTPRTSHDAAGIKQMLKNKAAELKLYGYNFPIHSPLFGKDMIQYLKDQGLWISLWFVQNEKLARKAVETGGCAVVTDSIKIVKAAARTAEAAQDAEIGKKH